MAQLRERYDRVRDALRYARINTKKLEKALQAAKEAYDRAVQQEHTLERQLANVTSEIDQALNGLAPKKRTGTKPSDAADEEPPSDAAPEDFAEPLPRSLQELVDAFPPGKSTGLPALKEHLALSDGGLNARIQKAKRTKLVERIGWGEYQLTPHGETCRTRRLELVGTKGGRDG